MNWNDFCIGFCVNKEGELFFAKKNEMTVLQCSFANGMIDVAFTYDFRMDAPLHVRGKAKLGDTVQVHILPYRIELYVEQELLDEEWPFGNLLLPEAVVTANGADLVFTDWNEAEKEEPCVSGVFQNAETWSPGKNVFVGDCMPYCYQDTYHVLYLKDRHHHGSKWGLGAHQWSHVSTKDFINWEIHPMAVAVDRPKEGSICTGSWIFDEKKHYLFYTVRMCDGSPAEVCRSVSEDGYHFEKDRGFCFVLSEKYTAPSARDPKVVKDADGIYHMFLTSSIRESGLGCLVHLTSTDLDVWTELEEPIYIAPAGKGEPECPDYFYKDGYYYLIYSLHGKAYYQYSKEPFTAWQVPADPIIPCKTVPKGAIWRDRLIFTGYNADNVYAGTMAFLEAVVQEDGQLEYLSAMKPF